MLCSDCSRVIRPVVAVDIDGTLGDYHSHFIKFARQYLATNGANVSYMGDRSFGGWFCSVFGVDIGTFRQIKLAYRQGGMKRSMPAFPCAKELIRNLEAAGAEVWLTTTRPYLRLDNVDPDTRFWLGLYNIKFDGILYDEDKYAKLAQIVAPGRVVAVLDDLPEQYDAAAAVYGADVPILRKNAYNQNVYRAHEVGTLTFAAEAITERITKWERQHGDR